MFHFCFSLLSALVLASPISFAKTAFDQAAVNIPRFRIVNEAIFAGGNPVSNADGEKGLEALLFLNVSTVINLQGGDIDDSFTGIIAGLRQKGEWPEAIAQEKAYFESRHKTYFNFPLNSHAPKTAQEDLDIQAALLLMSEATPERPLFIHCEHGADRTGLLIALFRVVHQGWSPEDAHKEWVANGHSRLSRLFTGHLDDYFYRVTGYSPVMQASKASCTQLLN